MNSIKSLQRGVINSLRSSVVLFDLPRVVEELVYNSLDSDAAKVYVSINVRTCYVKVEDDGCGITRDNLVLLGERYATSKSRILYNTVMTNESFGYRGEALASLSDVSIVEIRTKARGTPNAYCKIIKGSKCLYFGIDDQREAVGTTVIVRELFYNQPVRRNYLQLSPKRVLHSIKKCVLRIALVQPHMLFKVTDIASEDELLCTIPSSSPLPLISDGFGHEVSSSLQEVVFSDGVLMLSGYISRLSNAFSTKAFQYIYINYRFVCKGPIHNLLNNLAANFQCSLIRPEFPRGKRQKRQEYPAFLLNLRCPMSSYDLHFEPSKTIVQFKEWNTILFFFEKVIQHFWGRESEKEPLEANKHNHDDDLPMESAMQEEDLFCTGLLKSSKIDEAECDLQISQNEPTDDDHKQGKSSDSMHSFPWLKPCKRKIENVPEASYSSQLRMHDSLDTFFQLDYANSNQNVKSDYSELNCDPFHFIGHDEKNQFPSPCFTTDRKLEEDWSPLAGYDKLHSAFLSNRCSFDVDFDHVFSPFHDNVRSLGHTHFQEEDDNYRPSVSTVRKLYTNHELDVSPYHKNIFSREMESYEKNNILANSKVDWYLCTPQSLSTQRLRTDAQVLNSVQRSSYALFPSSDDMTEMNFHYGIIPKRNLQNESPSIDQNTPEKVSSSALFDNLTGWSPLGSCNMTDTDICSKYAFQTSMQLQDEGSGCLQDNLDFENHQESKIQKVRSRSCSAPPFYKAKYKYSSLTMIEGKDYNSKREHGLSQPPPSSQLCLKTIAKGIPQSSPRKCIDVKISTRDLGELNKIFHNQSTEGSHDVESALSTSSSQPCLKTNVNELSRTCFDVNMSTRLMDGIQKSGESDEACHNQISHDNSTRGPNVEDMECALSKWRTGIQQPTDIDESHMNNENILSISSGLLHLSSNSLIPESINKDCLENARVLLQLDRKFIPVMAGEILLVIDQHAADERIRLEELRQKVLSGEGTTVTYLDSEQELVLPEMGYQLLQKYAEQIQKWGWICNIHNQCSESFAKNVNILNRRRCGIALIAVPCILGISLSGKDLIEFIEQLVETDGSSTIPPSVHRILNSKACRGAIMFGDALLHSECSLIVEELKATSLCFQCAHGRPTTVPLVNMTSLHEQLAILDIEKEGTDERWHGLKRHAPSIERAQLRLESAKRFQTG